MNRREMLGTSLAMIPAAVGVGMPAANTASRFACGSGTLEQFQREMLSAIAANLRIPCNLGIRPGRFSSECTYSGARLAWQHAMMQQWFDRARDATRYGDER